MQKKIKQDSIKNMSVKSSFLENNQVQNYKTKKKTINQNVKMNIEKKKLFKKCSFDF